MKYLIFVLFLSYLIPVLFPLSEKAMSSFHQQRSNVLKRDSVNAKQEAFTESSVTQHHFVLHNQNFDYTATAGYLPVTDKGKPVAKIFYVAYKGTVHDSTQRRPVTFVFNGGPGSSSIWLHMGL